MKSKQKRFGHAKILCLVLSLLMMVSVMPMGATFASATDGEEVSSEVTLTEESVEPAESTEPEESEPDEETEESEPDEETEDTTYANSISGVLWIDANEDGTYDAGEQPLADYPVYLYAENDTDNAVDTATTDADGKYLFEDIEPGRYVVGVKAEENGTEYLLPLVGVQKDNKFYFTPDWSKVISNPIDIDADTIVRDINAAMRTMPQIQPMANTTYTINITSQATVTSSITTQSIPGVSIASNILTFANTVDPTDTYILTGTTTAVRVVVATGTTANITLDGVSISNAVCPLELQGTADVNLTLTGSNTLRCTGGSGTRSGLLVYVDSKITIGGTGALDAEGFDSGAAIGGSTGGTTYNPSGEIIINSGTITAKGGGGSAGIGGGGPLSNQGYATAITINGGTVTATGGYNGAGIGGSRANCGNVITINGGTVTATGGLGAAGIGAGNNSLTNGTITINGGVVTATGGEGSNYGSGAGIGGGGGTTASFLGPGADVIITGGTVTATGGTSTYSYRAAGIGGGTSLTNTNAASGTNVFTGGSIYPTNGYGVVSVAANTTNGNDPVGMLTLTSLAGQAFTINTSGSLGPYTYKGVGHTAAAYPWLTYPGVTTDTATSVSTTAAVVTAPSTVNSGASSTATLNGSYYLNNTYGVTSAYFEWGTSTSYGTTIDMTSSVNASTTTTGVYPVSSSALTGLTPGSTYHYRFVIVTNGVTVPGADMTFTSALAPSVDVTHDYPGGTTATLEGIYALNGGTFTSGEFEISSDSGSTWSTPTGGTLTGSTTTPTVNLTGLIPGTTYHYRLSVTNSVGTTTTVMKELTVSAKTVTISNEVAGAYANMDKSFTYTIYFQDSGGTALTGTFNYTGGVLTGSSATAPSGSTLTLGSGGEATVTLTTGQTITIADVATSAKVRVVQTTDANYTTSFKDSLDASSTNGADTGVRNMTAADRTFDYTNTRSVVPGGISTGNGEMVLLSLMALLALAAGLIITAVHRRRAGAR